MPPGVRALLGSGCQDLSAGPAPSSPGAQHHRHQHQTAAAPASATSTLEPIMLLLLTSPHLRWGAKPPSDLDWPQQLPTILGHKSASRSRLSGLPAPKLLQRGKKGAGKHFWRGARGAAVGQDASPGMARSTSFLWEGTTWKGGSQNPPPRQQLPSRKLLQVNAALKSSLGRAAH